MRLGSEKIKDANVCPTVVFSNKDGRADGYRIPALVATKNGTLVAVCDERVYSSKDFPNKIHKVCKTSADGGKTWSEYIMAVEDVGTNAENGSMSMDPSLLYDEDTNRIYMLFTRHPAGSSLLDADKGVAVDENGLPYVYKNGSRINVSSEGFLQDGSDYKADSWGNITDKNGNLICNTFSLDGIYTTAYTFFLCLCHTDDEGKTWSKPIHLNPMVKDENARMICAGPGIGIKLKNGKDKGTLVFPIYLAYRSMPPMTGPTIIYSKDGGDTWRVGKNVNSFRKHFGIFPMALDKMLPHEVSGESVAIEQADGSIKLFIRNESPISRIMVAETEDLGDSWIGIKYQNQLIHPVCQVSAITTKYKGRDVTLFLNSAHKRRRVNGIIRASFDFGKTFPYAKRIKSGDFIYSSMTILKDGSVGVLYEGVIRHTSIDYLNIKLEDIIGD